MQTPNESASAADVQSKRHYWLRDDFEELIGVIPNVDMPMGDSSSASFSLVYPKYTEGAAAELKLRGIECDGYVLTKMVDEGIVKPKLMRGSKQILQWDRADIDAAADYLYDNGHWTSWTHFCWVSNLRFGQAVKAHRVACIRNDYGFHVSFDIPGLVTVIEPSTSEDGYAHIRFYSADTKMQPQEVSH